MLRILVVMLVLLLTTGHVYAAPTYGFIAGAEVGDTSEMTTGCSTGAVDTSIVRSGNYSYKFVSGASCTATMFISANDIYVRFFMYGTSNPSVLTDIVRFTSDFNGIGMRLLLQTDGKVRFAYVNTTAIATSTNSITLSSWNIFEVHLHSAPGSADGLALILNNVTEISDFTADRNFYLPNVIFGPTAGGGQTYYFDDIAISEVAAPASTGKIIARQGRSGTPTDTGWTLSGCSTSTECMSETPASGTKKITSTTANSAQTMLLGSFSSTQAGHGSETLSAGDRIDAINIAAHSFPTNLIRYHRYRISGGTAVDTAPRAGNGGSERLYSFNSYKSGSDSGSIGELYTDTLTNLNNYEIGVVHENNSNNDWVYDMWTIVEYCPGCLGAITDKVHKTRQN